MMPTGLVNVAYTANEFYLNAINVMRGAEAISSYTSLPRQEAFDIEYWLLEEAKLQRMPKPKSLSGRVAFVTGSAGGIGKAIAKKMAQEGACVVLNDVNSDRLAEAKEEFIGLFGRDSVTTVIADVTSQPSIEQALKDASLAFGRGFRRFQGFYCQHHRRMGRIIKKMRECFINC